MSCAAGVAGTLTAASRITVVVVGLFTGGRTGTGSCVACSTCAMFWSQGSSAPQAVFAVFGLVRRSFATVDAARVCVVAGLES